MKPERLIENKLAAVGSVLMAVAAVFTATDKLLEVIPATVKGLVETAPWVRWAFLGVLVVLGLWMLRVALARRSRLLQPERFIIRNDEPRFLKGREDEVRELRELCETRSLVFLEGESGSGKSALVKAGLKPACLDSKRLLPVYVDLAGADWEDRLASQVAREFWHALSTDQRAALKLPVPPATDARLWASLVAVPAKVGLQVLLVFDQVDDYQISHGEYFREPRKAQGTGEEGAGVSGVWIAADRLEETNSFWAAIAHRVRDQAIHALFVTRTDSAGGLATFRFGPEKTYRLARVSQNLIAPLLHEVTAVAEGQLPVVGHPDAGWDQLRSRLLRDLAANDAILPIQLAVCLQGLRRLDILSIGHYEGLGGAAGLERLHIERNLADAALAAGVPIEALRACLLRLTDATRLKSRQATVAELGEVATSRSRPVAPAALAKALDVLEKRDVLRRQSGESADVWHLYHDYLSRGVLAAHRAADRWNVLLSERRQRFREASGLWAQWQALPSVSDQARLFLASLRGQFRWRSHWRFALLALTRMVPLLVLAGLGLLGIKAYQAEKEASLARELFRTIGTGASDAELADLRQISRSSTGVRQNVLRLALANQASAARARRHPEALLVACLTLDPNASMRSVLDAEIRAALQSNTNGTEVPLLCANWANRTTIATGRLRSFLTERLIGHIETEQDSVILCSLIDNLWSFAPGFASNQVAQIAKCLVKQIAAEPNSGHLGYLALRLTPLAARLSTNQLETVIDRFVGQFKAEQNPSLLSVLAKSLTPLAPGFPPNQLARLAECLVGRIESEQNSDRLAPLANGIEPLVARLDINHRATLADRLVRQIETEQNSDRLDSLAWSLNHFAAGLADNHCISFAMRLVHRIETEQDSVRISSLAVSLRPFAAALDSNQALPVVDHLVRSLVAEREISRISHMADSLTPLAARLTDNQLAPLAVSLVSRIETEQDSGRLHHLADSLTPLAGGLATQTRAQLAERMTQQIETEQSSHRLSSLARNLTPLATGLTSNQLAYLAKRLVRRIETEQDTNRLNSLARSLPALASGLATSQLAPLAQRLARRIVNEHDSDRLSSFVRNLTPFVTGLASNQLTLLTEHLVRRVEAEQDSDRLSSLAWSLTPLASNFSSNQLAQLVDHLVRQITIEQDTSRISHLAWSLTPLAEGLATNQLARVADSLVRQIEIEQSSDHLNHLARSLAPLANGLSIPAQLTLLKDPGLVMHERWRQFHTILLAELERRAGPSATNFTNSVWNFVSWAQTNRNHPMLLGVSF